jgi:Icc-related predicted phosphoesterase
MRWFRKDKPEPSKKFTRIFFATDIHGSEPCFMKFLNAASFYKADVLVLGGDITGKQVVTIEQCEGYWRSHLFGQEQIARTPEELARIEASIRSNGYYPAVLTPPEIAELKADQSKVDRLFAKLMTETVTRWVKIAEERLRGQPVKCFISPGNDDHFELDPILSSSDVVLFPEGQIVDLDGTHTMASCGYANMTPWHCPRDIEEDELRARLEEILANLDEPSHCVFNFHAPPYDSGLDIAAELDENLTPVMSAGSEHLIPVGSRAVREMIEKYHPLVGLHGHIHESRGAVEVGKTMCLNPGSEYSEGILRGALVNISNGKLLSHQFVSG